MTRQHWLEQLGAAIAAARAAAGLSLADVGELVGVHRQTVHRWERGDQAPDAWHWAVLCSHLRGLRLPRV